MSYDLFFTKPDFSYKEFAAFFTGRANYRVSEQQAIYENEETGCYLTFDYSNEESQDPDAIERCASFNLNYFRPHYLGLEAEPEIRSFVEQFGLKVSDPQGEIEGDEYNTQGFLRGWNAGNEFTYKVFLNSEDAPPEIFARPTEELERIWRWNYARKNNQEKLGEDVFVPKIIFVQLEGKLLSTIIWTDAISTLIPLVDVVGIYRMDTAPRRMPSRRKYLPRRAPKKNREDMCFAPFDNVTPLIKRYEVGDYSLAAFFLDYDKPPAEILRFVKSRKAFAGQKDLVGMEQVLNLELVEKYGTS